MKHSAPELLFGFIPLVSLLIIGSWVFAGWGFAVFAYVFNGFLVFLIGSGVVSFPKTIIMWYPAMLFDKPEWLDKPE